jgi:hypothetical protein
MCRTCTLFGHIGCLLLMVYWKLKVCVTNVSNALRRLYKNWLSLSTDQEGEGLFSLVVYTWGIFLSGHNKCELIIQI